MELEGKTAVVTGGSRGIGLAIAEAFLARGAKVLITGRKDVGLEAALAALREKGHVNARGVAAHSARPEDVAKAFDEAERTLGPVQVVVNNAATNPVLSPLSELDLAVFDKVIDTNLKGYLVVAKEAIARLRRAKLGGSIINVSSVAARRAWPGLGAYGVTKAAVDMLTRVLAAEAGKDGIRVNGIAPGVVRTRFSEALWKEPGAEHAAVARVPLGRIAEPRDIAGAAVFLASDLSSYLTGQTIVLDGGMTAL